MFSWQTPWPDRGKKGKKWEHIAEDLRQAIAARHYPSGSKLPTEEKLVKAYRVSRTTVRRAISELKAEKLVDPKEALGTFVTPDALDMLGQTRPDPSNTDIDLRVRHKPYYHTDGTHSVDLYPEDRVTCRLPTPTEVEHRRLPKTDLLMIIWRTNGRVEVYRAFSTTLVVSRQSPPASPSSLVPLPKD